jgi:tRNA threonylcarbamoyladenosine biosynthesis protein TsaB
VIAENPRLLILETSCRVGQVAVAGGGAVRGATRLEETRRLARDLAPAVADLLRAQGWSPRDLHGVVVGLGPGSYTGLRVGLASAKALAYATGCALLGVESFTAVAVQAPADGRPLDVLADAQQDRVYVQPFAAPPASGPPVAIAPLAIRTVADWLAGRDPSARVSGPGVEAHAARLPQGLDLVEPDLRLPRPESLLRLALPRYRTGERDDLWALEPIYLRPSAAEEQWRRLGRG